MTQERSTKLNILKLMSFLIFIVTGRENSVYDSRKDTLFTIFLVQKSYNWKQKNTDRFLNITLLQFRQNSLMEWDIS